MTLAAATDISLKVSSEKQGASWGGTPAMWTTLFLLSALVRCFCLTGLIGSDDLGYSAYAQNIASGTYHLEAHHYALRYGVILPLAVVYRLFGVHEWTTIALPLISSTMSPVLAAILALRLSGRTAAWIAGLLLATFPADIRYASILVPEPFLQSSILLCAITLVVALELDSIGLAVVAGVIGGLSYLIKEPGIFAVIGLVAYAVVRKRWTIAFACATGIAAVVGAELLWYWSQSGDLLFRVHSMALHNQTPEAVEANQNLFDRLFLQYPRWMLLPNPHYGLHSLLVLALSVVALIRLRSPWVFMLCLWAAVPLLYLNFGSSSFRQYWALPSGPRYLSFVYVPLFILSALILSTWMQSVSGRRAAAVTAVVAIVGAIGLGCAIQTRGKGYRTAEVVSLKKIAQDARANHWQICRFSGPRAITWRETVHIVAPDVMGCGGTSLQIVPDGDSISAITQSSNREY